MSKKFTTKELKLRARAKRRRQSLKVDKGPLQRKPTLEEKNREVIASIEAKIKG